MVGRLSVNRCFSLPLLGLLGVLPAQAQAIETADAAVPDQAALAASVAAEKPAEAKDAVTLQAMEVDPKWRRVMQALIDGDGEVVRALNASDRAILLAALALKSDQPSTALQWLNDAVGDDPLASLLRAEAHRRQALKAVHRAGDYARNVRDKERLLASADLSSGLGEADARLQAFMDRLDAVAGVPLDLLLPGPGIANVFLVDKARSRLFLYERDDQGEFRRVADEYVVTGSASGDKTSEGDGRTPNGVYRFVGRLQGREIEARYGPVAFPIDYPNALDRLHGKDGHGIWMHGYPADVKRRPPQDTRGCFSLPNPRLLAMADHVKLGRSWVIVGENLRFGEASAREALRQSVRDALESWRRDWMSLDTEAYLSHYHPRFRSGKRDLAAWKRYKRRINAGKKFIEVKFSNLSLIHDPNRWPEGEVVVAEFDQDYRSSNYSDRGRKRMYLAREHADAPWRILLEESVRP